MNTVAVGIEVARLRREAGLTQAELAARIGTKQPNISRLESGRTRAGQDLFERISRALGRPLTVTYGATAEPSRDEVRRRVLRVVGPSPFNPWDRSPTAAEAASLNRDGLTRERFQSQESARRSR